VAGLAVNKLEEVTMLERVEYLIENYMKDYEVGFDEAIDMMIEDLNQARENDELRKDSGG